MDTTTHSWCKVADLDELPPGRVRTVAAGRHSLALTRVGDGYGALDNRCPHQGGPLGEGSIEKGWLRCPWHGYDYDPLTGTPPPGFTDAPAWYPVEVRDDGVYVGLPDEVAHVRTVSDVMVETMVAWGVTHVFGMVGHSNLGFADAMRAPGGGAAISRFIGIRHEGAAVVRGVGVRQAHRPARRLLRRSPGPGSTNLLTGLYDAKVDRAPVLALSGQVPSKVLGRGAFQDVDLTAAFADVAVLLADRAARLRPRRADDARAASTRIVERDVAHLVLPDEVQELPAADGSRGRARAAGSPTTAVAPPAAALDDAVRADRRRAGVR